MINIAMEKKSLIFIFILAIVFSNLFLVRAQLADIDPTTGKPLVLGINPDNFPQNEDEVANMTRNYLSKEWGKVISNSTVLKPLYNFYKNFQKPIDTISLWTVGMTPSLSWLYLLALFLWLTLVDFSFGIASLIPQQKNENIDLVEKIFLSIAIIILISIFGIASMFANLIVKLLREFNTINGQIIVISIIFLILIILNKYSLQLKKFSRNLKQKRKLETAITEAKEAKRMAKKSQEPSEFEKAMEEAGQYLD